MNACAACGRGARKLQAAFVIPEGKVRRVCGACARRGVLVVAQLLTMAPIRKGRPHRLPDLLDDIVSADRKQGR